LRFVCEEVKKNVETLAGWNVNTLGRNERPATEGQDRKEKKGTMYRAPTKASAQPGLAVPRDQQRKIRREGYRRSKKHLRGDGEDAEGAARAVDNFEGRGDDDGAGGRQLIEIAEAGKAEFSAAVHDEMI